MKNKTGFIIIAAILILLAAQPAGASAPISLPGVDIDIRTPEEPQQVVDSVKLLVLLTVLTLAPSLLTLLTSFTRIIVVFSLLRRSIL